MSGLGLGSRYFEVPVRTYVRACVRALSGEMSVAVAAAEDLRWAEMGDGRCT
jgi:hypothetical protein